MYAPGVLVPKVTAPVPGLIVNPAGAAEYVPPGVPVCVGAEDTVTVKGTFALTQPPTEFITVIVAL